MKRVFDTAKERVLIVSPFISDSALSADKIPALVAAAVSRNVEVTVFVDDLLNHDSSGELKTSAKTGISALVSAGAKVTIVKGIHNKTLAMDTDLIAEGSFNWLSAVRTVGGTHQREERTIIVEGNGVASMIEKELRGLVNHSNNKVVSAHRVSGGGRVLLIAVGAFVCVLLIPVFIVLSPFLIPVFIIKFLTKKDIVAPKSDLYMDSKEDPSESPFIGDKPFELAASIFEPGYIGVFSSHKD